MGCPAAFLPVSYRKGGAGGGGGGRQVATEATEEI